MWDTDDYVSTSSGRIIRDGVAEDDATERRQPKVAKRLRKDTPVARVVNVSAASADTTLAVATCADDVFVLLSV